MVDCTALNIFWKHHTISDNIVKIHEVLKKVDPILKCQKKLMINKEDLSKNIMSKEDVAKFLKSFQNFNILMSTLDEKLVEIQQLTQFIEKHLILHYQYC